LSSYKLVQCDVFSYVYDQLPYKTAHIELQLPISYGVKKKFRAAATLFTTPFIYFFGLPQLAGMWKEAVRKGKVVLMLN
jgi:hypothetical protein